MNNRFIKILKNPFVISLLLAVLILWGLIYGTLVWLDIYTRHNEAVVIPDVKGMTIEEAAPLLAEKGIRYNIIDSVFYGVIFDHSFGQVATLFPEGGGYAGWLHGKVVDMFYFPLIETTWPDWLPIWGGQEFIFFRPIFNLADSAICVGVFLLLLFYRNTFSKSLGNEEK